MEVRVFSGPPNVGFINMYDPKEYHRETTGNLDEKTHDYQMSELMGIHDLTG